MTFFEGQRVRSREDFIYAYSVDRKPKKFSGGSYRVAESWWHPLAGETMVRLQEFPLERLTNVIFAASQFEPA